MCCSKKLPWSNELSSEIVSIDKKRGSPAYASESNQKNFHLLTKSHLLNQRLTFLSRCLTQNSSQNLFRRDPLDDIFPLNNWQRSASLSLPHPNLASFRINSQTPLSRIASQEPFEELLSLLQFSVRIRFEIGDDMKG